MGLSAMAPVQTAQAVVYTSAPHTFSINDVQGDFQGNTFGGAAGIPADPTIICGAGGGSPACPPGIAPITDTKLLPNQNITLYPIDSEFGYEVIDFLGAAQKTRDNDYLEGFVGNITSGFPTSALIDGVTVNFSPAITGGIAVSNAATDTYKVKPPMGTWCRGLGGNSVKCETEHYSVMEHILSCHELIPYFFADPVTGVQAVLNPGSVDIPTLAEFDCADAGLDDIALIMVNGTLGPQLVDGTPCDAVNDPPGCQMFPNDKTDTQNNVALTTDYSVQLKDDGKALYGWGTIHKRPNDVRLYASLPVPQEWKDNPNNNYVINSAKLIVRHHITNNPNDQLRPEDLENEAATGRKPAYTIEGTIGGTDEVWKSSKSCYEGDSDLIDTEDGNVDPTFLGIGTVFKNTQFAITTSPPTSIVPTNDTDLPYPLSSDLTGAFTNGWYTTIDRDPFEWSYDMNPDPTIQDFEGTWLEDDGTLAAAGGVLVSGPRWRLKPNKYGQDLPGLEIAIDAPLGGGTDGADCYAPPFAKELIKYPVGEATITEINLLDWETATTSPLKYSRGWMDVTQNNFVTVAGTNTNVPYTTNGLPMTDDFDLAVYVKGDRKATAVYDAQLVIDYALAPPVVVPDVTGLTQAAADAALQAVDLVVGVITQASDPLVPAGSVISQNPVAGTTVFAGSAVDLVISTGPGVINVVVPNVTGLTQAAATAALQADNLVVGVITQASDPVVPAGSVISQNPVAGTTVVSGSAVDLVISTGPVATLNVTAEWVRLISPFSTNRILTIIYNVVNNDSVPVTGTAVLAGSDGSSFTTSFTNLAPGAVQRVTTRWTTPATPQTVNFTVTVTVNGVVTDTLPGSIVVQ